MPAKTNVQISRTPQVRGVDWCSLDFSWTCPLTELRELQSRLLLDVSTDGISFVAHNDGMEETNVSRARPNSGVKCHTSISISTFGNVGFHVRNDWSGTADKRKGGGDYGAHDYETDGHGYGPGKDAP
jgi:hypothetical protein